MIAALIKKFSSVLQFFFLSAALFAVLTIILIVFSNSIIRQSFLTRVTNSVNRTILSEAKTILRPDDFAFEQRYQANVRFDTLFRRIRTVEIIRVKAWDTQSRVIFSDDASIVGERFADNEPLQKALQGEIVAEVQSPVKPENIAEQGYEQLVELYIPITFEGTAGPVGVIEAYFTLDNVLNQIAQTQKILVVAILVFVGTSFILLFILFRIVVFRESQFLRLVIDTSPDLIFVKDWNGKFMLVNTALADMYNSTPELLVGKTDADYNSNREEVAGFLAADRRVMQTREPSFIKEELVTNAKTGERRWFQTVKVPIISGKSTHVLGRAIDITDRKKIEQAKEETKKAMLNVMEDLEEQKKTVEALVKDLEKFKLAVDNTSDLVIITDRDGIVIYGNHAVLKNTGYEVSDILGKKAGTLWGRQMPPEYYKNFWDTIKTKKETFTGEIRNRKKNGDAYTAALNVSPVLDKSGDIVYFVSIERDVTQEKAIENAKTEFVSIASHALRTPLTAIDGLMSMILDGEYGEVNHNLKEPLTDVSISSERLIHLVNDLLNISRIQSGRMKYALSEFSIADAIRKTVHLLQPLAQKKGLQLTVAKLDEVLVLSDEDKVEEILNNLIGNALKFTDRGSVTIASTIVGDKAEIRITDTGIGLTEEDQQKLFGLFQQLEAGHGRPMGTGFGLHISKEILAKMGGELWLEKSALGVGSTFAFSLPRAQSTAATQVKVELEKEERAHPDISDTAMHAKSVSAKT